MCLDAWLGRELVLHSDLASLVSVMLDLGGGKKERLGFLLTRQFGVVLLEISKCLYVLGKDMYVL